MSVEKGENVEMIHWLKRSRNENVTGENQTAEGGSTVKLSIRHQIEKFPRWNFRSSMTFTSWKTKSIILMGDHCPRHDNQAKRLKQGGGNRQWSKLSTWEIQWVMKQVSDRALWKTWNQINKCPRQKWNASNNWEIIRQAPRQHPTKLRSPPKFPVALLLVVPNLTSDS